MSLSQNNRPAVGSIELYPRLFGPRYTLLKELGQGGMGQIFIALTGQEGAERVCALKVIRQLESPGREPHELGKRFLDEAKVVTKLSHENLVYVFDFGMVGEQGYLAMEYLRGKTLAELWNRCALRKVGFPMGVTLHLVSEIAAGLAYAHGLEPFDLVHRDISPSNVMLSYTGGVKLIDFGLAKWRSKLAQTMSGVNWGKVSYMSPEQHTGKPIDHRSDIFSLGLILWELLTGRQLYPNEQARADTTTVPPPSQFNGAVEEGLDRVVLKALAFDPTERFQSAAGFGQSLARFMPKDASKLGLSHFLAQLFDSDAKTENTEEEALVARAAAAIKARPSGTYLAALPQNQTPADPMIGLVLADRYFIKRLIGEGAMGRVYEGHHTGIGKRVAIKVPRHAERRKSELVERFKLEANAASQIGHANIADVTDCGTTAGGDFFFVMEYVDGVDLSKLIRRDGQMQIERSLLVGVQICRALEAAHRVGIIHRDLKPGNVMLVREREGTELVKVLDFGVAKFLRSTTNDELTNADAAVGTPRYMAPEQVDASKNVDFRVDIYGVGGLLYAMLTGGQSPDPGETVQEVWQRKLHDAAVPIKQWRTDLPANLEKLIMKTLERKPEDRPQSMAELKQDLVKVLETVRANGSSVMAMKAPAAKSNVMPSATARMPRVVMKKYRVLWLAAAAIGVGIVVWAVVLGTKSGAPPKMQPARTITTAPIAKTIVPVVAEKSIPEPPSVAPVVKEAAPIGTTRTAHSSHSLSGKPGTSTPKLDADKTAIAAVKTANAFEASLLLAEQEFRKGNLLQAILLAEKSIQQGAGARGYVQLGKAHLYAEEFNDAIRAYKQALKLEAGNAAAQAGLTRAEEQLKAQ